MERSNNNRQTFLGPSPSKTHAEWGGSVEGHHPCVSVIDSSLLEEQVGHSQNERRLWLACGVAGQTLSHTERKAGVPHVAGVVICETGSWRFLLFPVETMLLIFALYVYPLIFLWLSLTGLEYSCVVKKKQDKWQETARQPRERKEPRKWCLCGFRTFHFLPIVKKFFWFQIRGGKAPRSQHVPLKELYESPLLSVFVFFLSFFVRI